MATCKNCGNTCGSQGKCGCNDSVLHLPPNCNPPNCPNPEPCPETFSDCCTIHNGDSFAYVQTVEVPQPGPQFTVYQGERLCDTWQRFISYYFCQTQNNIVYGLKSQSITSTTLTIGWTPLVLTSADSYEVFYSPVNSLSFVSAGTVAYNSSSPSLTITGLTPNTSYYVYVLVNKFEEFTCPSVSLILTTKVS